MENPPFFFLIERGRHLLFLHPTTWRDIPLPQGSCNSTATAQEKRRRAHFPLLPFVLFRQTWQLAVTSRRAGSERTGVSPRWLDSFFTPFQPLMFPSKWSTDPFVYRLQRPLGGNQTRQTKPLEYKHRERKFISKLLDVLQHRRTKPVTRKKSLAAFLTGCFPWVSGSLAQQVCFFFTSLQPAVIP